MAITGYGAAGAYKVTQHLSVGGALVVYEFDLDAEFKRYFLDGFFDPVNRDVSLDNLRNYTTQSGSDFRVAPVAGATYDRDRIRMGIVYRHGASFDFETESVGIAAQTATFRVPHTFSVGASHRLSPQWLLAAEVTHVWYSRLREDYITSQTADLAPNFSISSGTEVHGGVQYAWRRAQGPPIRFRGGAWYDPDHSVKFTQVIVPPTSTARLSDEVPAAALSQGSSRVHGTGGVGWTITPRLELNVGVDVAERSSLVSTSLIVHLGRTP
jgi:long-subunit fatty acid transport protein